MHNQLDHGNLSQLFRNICARVIIYKFYNFVLNILFCKQKSVFVLKSIVTCPSFFDNLTHDQSKCETIMGKLPVSPF
jgi:hypothetical protein